MFPCHSHPKWLWVPNRYPKWNPGKRKPGPKPAVPWLNFDPYPSVHIAEFKGSGDCCRGFSKAKTCGRSNINMQYLAGSGFFSRQLQLICFLNSKSLQYFRNSLKWPFSKRNMLGTHTPGVVPWVELQVPAPLPGLRERLRSSLCTLPCVKNGLFGQICRNELPCAAKSALGGSSGWDVQYSHISISYSHTAYTFLYHNIQHCASSSPLEARASCSAP